MLTKILIIPARRHVAEAYCEYLIRYLGDEFDIQMGYPTIGNDSPLAKDPDDFDLIYPQFDSHWHLPDPEKYAHKTVNVFFEPAGPRFKVAAVAGTSKSTMEPLPEGSHEVRFGIDLELFKPFPQPKDNKLHVGFMGNIQTPRRYIKELFIEPLKDLEGVKLDIYPMTWSMDTRPDELELMGGQAVIDNIEDGDKWWPGLPNLYNRMDVFVRVDINHGYQFSVMEAAACGVPVVCTDSGPTREITDESGGICIGDPKGDWSKANLNKYAKKVREAIIYLRDHTNERLIMGTNARQAARFNFSWEKWLPKWREFFREGLNASL